MEDAMTMSAADEHYNQRCADGFICLEHAMRYRAELGWSILAICPPDHMSVGEKHAQHCKSPGKAPWGKWKEFQDRLPTEDEIRRKWSDNPTLNVGVALGPVSGIIRVDVDGPAGESRLLELSGGTMPPTLEFTSGRSNGGRGLLFRIPDGVAVRTTVEQRGAPKQELRFQARGAQTVLPPSRHPEGCLYAWVPNRGPWEIEVTLAPAWLVAQIQEEPRVAQAPRAPVVDGEQIPEGMRDTTLTSMAGTMRKRGFTVDAILAALLVENEIRCEPPLDEIQVTKIAESIGRYAPGGMANARRSPLGAVVVEI
jgi:putative DNA primase/helicase